MRYIAQGYFQESIFEAIITKSESERETNGKPLLRRRVDYLKG